MSRRTKIFHFRKLGACGVEPRGGVTVAVGFDKEKDNGDKRAVVTVALCSPDENYRKKKGVHVAAGRLTGFYKKYDSGQVDGHVSMHKYALALIDILSDGDEGFALAVQAARTSVRCRILADTVRGAQGKADYLNACIDDTVTREKASKAARGAAKGQ